MSPFMTLNKRTRQNQLTMGKMEEASHRYSRKKGPLNILKDPQ